jgi:hypothetical protein
VLEFMIIAMNCGFSWRPGLSAGDLVLAGELAGDLFSADPVPGKVDLRWPGLSLSGSDLARARCGRAAL